MVVRTTEVEASAESVAPSGTLGIKSTPKIRLNTPISKSEMATGESSSIPAAPSVVTYQASQLLPEIHIDTSRLDNLLAGFQRRLEGLELSFARVADEAAHAAHEVRLVLCILPPWHCAENYYRQSNRSYDRFVLRSGLTFAPREKIHADQEITTIIQRSEGR